MKYVDLVQVGMGTDSIPTFSRGNTAPLATLPFGMASFGIETRPSKFSLFYHPDDPITTGVRLTHLPSPWIADYAFVTFMPQTGQAADLTANCKSGYRRREALMKPYALRLTFLRYRARMELAPTMRGCAADVTWERADETHRLALHFGPHMGSVRIDAKRRRIYGTVSTHYWPVPDNFKMCFVLELDRNVDLEHTVVGYSDGTVLPAADRYKGENLELNLALAQDGRDRLHFTVGTSFISFDQAKRNAAREVAGKTVEQLEQAAADAWDDKLSRIEIETQDADLLKTFYSCLYRVFMFPRTLYEYDGQDRMIHYSPADGKIYPGPMFTDNGFWDTYMTVYPLFSLIAADEYARMCEGFLNYYKEAGWLPRWMSPAALDSMPGTSIDQVFADAAVKGIVTDQETLRLMLEATEKHANLPGEKPQFGRDGIAEYLRLRYLPCSHRESVNKTQNYAYGDFAIAQLALCLHNKAKWRTYMGRCGYWRNLFDAETGFMRARDADGNMREDWTQFDWGWDYTEGGPWQNSFAVPHDMLGLADALGGRAAMIEKMDRLFATPPYYRPFGYHTEIHEMTEMAAVDFGQCALSNQPSFHIPYIYTMMGAPSKTAYWVRKAVRELFHWNVGYPGDEDNGSMSGWYVFSVMGLYPVCPGVPQYVLGSPAVRRCVIHTHAGTDFVINAYGNDADKVYWREAALNGRPYGKLYLSHKDIMNGGMFTLNMTPYPPTDDYGEEALPYSVSRDAHKW